RSRPYSSRFRASDRPSHALLRYGGASSWIEPPIFIQVLHLVGANVRQRSNKPLQGLHPARQHFASLDRNRHTASIAKDHMDVRNPMLHAVDPDSPVAHDLVVGHRQDSVMVTLNQDFIKLPSAYLMATSIRTKDVLRDSLRDPFQSAADLPLIAASQQFS